MSKQSYDLHCHSNQSDGILSPEELVSRAKLHEVSVLALTDHDTIAGIARARAQAAIEGIELINGIEFSCNWKNRNVHIVALAFDLDNAELVQTIESQTVARQRRSEMIGERLARVGMPGMTEKACAIAAGGSVGRPHFAKAMVEAGHVSSIDQAFKRYLGAGKPGDIKQVWPEIGDILDVIVQAGGIAVLAHPLKYKITRTKLLSLIDDFHEYGGRAIEVVSGVQKPQDTRDMARIATKYGLMGSCGSDFHAPNMHWAELGKVSALPDEVEPVWHHWQQ